MHIPQFLVALEAEKGGHPSLGVQEFKASLSNIARPLHCPQPKGLEQWVGPAAGAGWVVLVTMGAGHA